MSISLPPVNYAANGDVWQTALDKVNAVINTIANSVVTANTNANGALTTGNGFVNGIFGANTLVVTTLRGGNVQSSAALTITSNVAIQGGVFSLGNTTVNVAINSSSFGTGNVFLSGAILQIGNTTANMVSNSTALVINPSMVLTGSSLTFGNSTVNAVVNTTGVSLSGVAMPLANNKASVAVDNILIGNATRINFSGAGAANVSATLDTGGSQVNVIINASVSLGGGAGGSNTTILFNDSSAIGGTTGFTFDKTQNNVGIANTLVIGGGAATINGGSLFLGNTTVNAISNSTTHALSNSTLFTIYGLSGWSVGANVQTNTSSFTVGNSTVQTFINSTSVSTANITFSGQISAPGTTILPGQTTWGNSTVNVVANSTVLTIGGSGGLVQNASTIAVGANVVVNTSSALIGNSTQSFTSNSSQMQVANATVASIVNSNGLAIGGNVSLTFSTLTIGNTTANSTVIFLGNTTVSSTINSTSFSGTSNNALRLGGVLAANYLNTTGGATITGGFNFTPFNLGTGSGVVTPNPLNQNYQYMTNNGAFTIAAPSSDCAIDILLTNGASAGSITFSGFTVGSSIGDPLTTTNGHRFILSIRRINTIAAYTIKALQ